MGGCAFHDECDEGVLVCSYSVSVLLYEGGEVEVGDDVSAHQHKVPLNQVQRVQMTQRIPHAVALLADHHPHCTAAPLQHPTGRDVLADGLGVGAAEDEQLLDAA